MAEAPLSVVFGPGSHHTGDLVFEGRVRVDGTFEGRLYTDGELEVGVDGRVDGDVDVARATISGAFHGRLRVRERLILRAGCVVDGLVDAGVMEMAPGARLRGEVRVEGEETP